MQRKKKNLSCKLAAGKKGGKNMMQAVLINSIISWALHKGISIRND
jgi:hypothetical protein